MITRYFWNGFQHAAFALVCVAVFYRVHPSLLYKSSPFWAGVIFSSSALFFIPLHIGKSGSLTDKLYQFLHYPLPDWDILFCGMKWHRFFATHSLLLPTLLFLENKKTPMLPLPLILGLSIGIGSHLIWDGVTGSMSTPIVFIPYLFSIKGYWAKGWLIVNGLLLLAAPYYVQTHKL